MELLKTYVYLYLSALVFVGPVQRTLNVAGERSGKGGASDDPDGGQRAGHQEAHRVRRPPDTAGDWGPCQAADEGVERHGAHALRQYLADHPGQPERRPDQPQLQDRVRDQPGVATDRHYVPAADGVGGGAGQTTAADRRLRQRQPADDGQYGGQGGLKG